MLKWLPAALFCLALTLLSACGGGGAESPAAREGVVDLTRWDFSASGAVELRGQWGFVWGSDPTAAFSGDFPQFIDQPGVWNRAGHPGLGRASLALTVMLPAGAPPLALTLPDVNSAYRLHLNGSPALQVGRLGDEAATEIPVYQRPLVRVPPGTRHLEIVIEISNHHHFEGGLGRALRLGPTEALEAERGSRQLVSVAALGALLVVLLLQLAFWAGGRHDRAFLLFAAFTALMAARASASGLVYAIVDPNLRADIWYLVPAYLTLFAFPGIYLAFLRELFPAEVPRLVVRPVVWLSLAAAAAVLVLPPALYTRLRDPFQVLVLLAPLAGLTMLAVAVWRRRPGAGWMLAGSSAFVATVVNDSLHYQRVIESADLSSLGFAALAVGYAAALSLKLFRSESEASARLAVLNRDLEDKVAERTASLA
ncbi:MAG TPA: 7TM diverse intracellular signaling domain-containing protein, partial [Candidatus Omnitrophota bacterium]|nr:7TM diverse intracellular signaling domain-containing protein [Candidatus Omnitrophota bacterium]